MDRLTMRNSDGSVSQPLNLNWAAALERLAAYEDTGLEPEEIEKAMAISALREQEERRWIPATERLPRNYTPVLACIPSLAQTKQQTVHECHIGADGEWHSATAPAYREAVTHWMPLPKPPKEV